MINNTSFYNHLLAKKIHKMNKFTIQCLKHNDEPHEIIKFVRMVKKDGNANGGKNEGIIAKSKIYK